MSDFSNFQTKCTREVSHHVSVFKSYMVTLTSAVFTVLFSGHPPPQRLPEPEVPQEEGALLGWSGSVPLSLL